MTYTTLKQRQKIHKKQSKNPKAMGYFTKFNCGNCFVNNAIFNNSTAMGAGSGPCAAADGGCGMVAPASAGGAGMAGAGGGMGENWREKENRNMKQINEDYENELIGPWELGIDFFESADFDNGDGTCTTRYTLCKPLAEEQIKKISSYSNVKYKKGGATRKSDPSVKYDTLYVCHCCGSDEEEEYDYEDDFDGCTCGECAACKETGRKSASEELFDKYAPDDIVTDEEEDVADFDDTYIDGDMFDDIDMDDPDYETEYDTMKTAFNYDFGDDPEFDDEYETEDSVYTADLDSEDYDMWGSDRYDLIDIKSVLDSDGFVTDYSLYYDNDAGDYFTVFGDMDTYDLSDYDDLSEIADETFETEKEAKEWFDSYEGFTEDEMEGYDLCYDYNGKKMPCGDGERKFFEKEERGNSDFERSILRNSLSKDEQVRKVAEEVKSLEDEVNFLTHQAPREVNKGGAFDTDEELDDALEAAKKALAQARAKYKTLTKEGRLNEASKD